MQQPQHQPQTPIPETFTHYNKIIKIRLKKSGILRVTQEEGIHYKKKEETEDNTRGSEMKKRFDPTTMTSQQVVNRKGGQIDTPRTMTDQMINSIHSFIIK